MLFTEDIVEGNYFQEVINWKTDPEQNRVHTMQVFM